MKKIFIIYFLIILCAKLSVEKKTMTIPKNSPISDDDRTKYYEHLKELYKSGRTQSSFIRNGLRAKEIGEALQAMSQPKSAATSQSKPLVRQDTWVWIEQREMELGKKV